MNDIDSNKKRHDTGSDLKTWACRSPALLVFTSTLIGLAAASPIGWLFGSRTYLQMAADCDTDGWCKLGAFVVALAVAAAIGYVIHAATGIIVIRRLRQAGQRWRVTLAHCAIPWALFGLFLVLIGV